MQGPHLAAGRRRAGGQMRRAILLICILPRAGDGCPAPAGYCNCAGSPFPQIMAMASRASTTTAARQIHVAAGHIQTAAGPTHAVAAGLAALTAAGRSRAGGRCQAAGGHGHGPVAMAACDGAHSRHLQGTRGPDHDHPGVLLGHLGPLHPAHAHRAHHAVRDDIWLARRDAISARYSGDLNGDVRVAAAGSSRCPSASSPR